MGRVRVILGHSGWETVKMYLESGKSLPERKAGIIVNFKDGRELFFDIHSGTANYTDPRGKLVESFHLKQGQEVWGGIVGKPYGTLLLHAFAGNRSSFVSTPEVQAQWKVVAPLLANRR